MPSTREKIAVVAPMASARVKTMVSVNPGPLLSWRSVSRRFCARPYIRPPGLCASWLIVTPSSCLNAARAGLSRLPLHSTLRARGSGHGYCKVYSRCSYASAERHRVCPFISLIASVTPELPHYTPGVRSALFLILTHLLLSLGLRAERKTLNGRSVRASKEIQMGIARIITGSRLVFTDAAALRQCRSGWMTRYRKLSDSELS